MVVRNNTLHIHHHFVRSILILIHSYLLPTPFVLLVATITLTHARSRALRSLTYISLSLADTVSICIIKQHISHTRMFTRTTYLLVAHSHTAPTARLIVAAPSHNSTHSKHLTRIQPVHLIACGQGPGLIALFVGCNRSIHLHAIQTQA